MKSPILKNPAVMILIRALIGVIVGVAYGLLVGAITWLQWRLTHDPRYPGPLIPDNNEWGRLVTFFTTVVVSFCGGLAGAVVGATQVNKRRGALLGGLIGLTFFLLFTVLNLAASGNALLTNHPYFLNFLKSEALHFLTFPIGLALVGVVTAFITGMLKTVGFDRT